MGVVEVGAALKAGGVEESILGEGGILKARIILKNSSIKEGRLAECAAGKVGLVEGGIAEVGPAQKWAFSKLTLPNEVPQKTAS